MVNLPENIVITILPMKQFFSQLVIKISFYHVSSYFSSYYDHIDNQHIHRAF